MSNSFQIERTAVEDGEMVDFGPVDPETRRQLSIPSFFERTVTLGERGLALTLACEFTGEKVEVTSLMIAASAGEYISSRDLTQLGLPSLINGVTKSVLPDWEYWVPEAGTLGPEPQGKDNYAFLAQVYWLQHISHGSPRQTLMRYLKMPRSTCNVLLRNIRKEFVLPVSD